MHFILIIKLFRQTEPKDLRLATEKPGYIVLGFSKLASIGSNIDGVSCENRLPRFFSMFLIKTKKKKTNKQATCIGGFGCDTVKTFIKEQVD